MARVTMSHIIWCSTTNVHSDIKKSRNWHDRNIICLDSIVSRATNLDATKWVSSSNFSLGRVIFKILDLKGPKYKKKRVMLFFFFYYFSSIIKMKWWTQLGRACWAGRVEPDPLNEVWAHQICASVLQTPFDVLAILPCESFTYMLLK